MKTWTPAYPLNDVGSDIVRRANRHIRLSITNYISLSEPSGVGEPEIECDNHSLCIGCTSISYEAFKKISDWWESTRKSNVRKMQ